MSIVVRIQPPPPKKPCKLIACKVSFIKSKKDFLPGENARYPRVFFCVKKATPQ
jgi:hypothetical protein